MQDEEPIDREAWRRALARDAGEPPRATDERIRAEARRVLAPHTGRWWLPASLAASLLLAVLIVQWQYEEIRSPAPVTEFDMAPPAAREAAPPAASPAEPAAADAAAAPMPAPAEERFVPPPRMEAPAAPAPAAADRAAPVQLAEPEADARRQPAGRAAMVPAQENAASAVTGLRQIGDLRSQEAAAAKPRTPEQWYAEIEALRKAGRNAEADAELARLEEAYPGWLEQHVAAPR